MRTEVRITQAQARQHQADLLAAIGADPAPSGTTARGADKSRARRRLQVAAVWRRTAAA
ncbi:MAG TPA: hypothetical protein VLB29_09860 [Nocardioidaceae bacterium]|nr:hypothetical protein [Nocardioidaceae bacterium]